MPGDDVFRFDNSDRDLRFRPASTDNLQHLEVEEVERFNADGHLGPLPGLDPVAADSLREYVDWLIAEVVSADDRRNAYSINQYHQVCRGLWDLLQTPKLVGYATDILGSEAVCWSTHLFCKLPGDPMAVPLHQDANYWPFSPTSSVTVWLAIDDVDDDNAAMHFVSGSHLDGGMAHDELELDGSVVLNRRVADVDRFDTRHVNELRAGEVSLHTDLLLHGSKANTSERRRAGIALRYLSADVRAVAGGENWITGAVHVADGDPSGYWPNRDRPAGEEPHRMQRFTGGFDGNN